MIQEHDLDLEFSASEKRSGMDRGDFLKTLGGGIFFFFTVGGPLALKGQRRGGSPPSDFNAYLRIDEDGQVSCFTGKIEMGQGIHTSLAQMFADELDVALDNVEMVMGDTDLCPYDRGTWGSQSTRNFGPSMRAAVSEARAVLLEMGAEHLKVPVKRLTVEQGIIYDKRNRKKQVSYAQLAKGQKIERHIDAKPTLKDFTEFKVVGQSILRRDAAVKVTGEAKYAGDIHFPDMLCAKILRPPAHGARLKRLDTSAVRGMSDVQLVEDDDLIAVLHKYPDVAERALDRIKADYDVPDPTADDKSIFKHLLKTAPRGEIVGRGGVLNEGRKRSDVIVEEEYLNSYVAHAPIEPHTAVAKPDGEKITVWASTQSPFGAKEEIASRLGLPSGNVRVITPFVGGGFGGKSRNQQAVEAARLAKKTGKPVQVMWSREEEFFFDTFRPAAIVKIASGTTTRGDMVFWDYGVYFAGERGSQHFYDIPHHRTMAHGSGWRGTPGTHPFGTGPWRAPANNTNTFARESQIDIMAAKVGMDPLEFRLKNLKDKKMRRVLKAAAKQFKWTPSKAPSGRGVGIACGVDAGSYVALMAEVEVNEKEGTVQARRVVCAQDMGLVINPEGATMQVEGCITMGLGYALSEEMHFNGGEIFDINFDTYEIPRFFWVPDIETVLIDVPNEPPQGGGEPAIVGMGAVIANAIFDASGARLFQLPMTPDRIMKALQKV